MAKEPTVYMLASKRNGTLYIGVTSDLPLRVYQHKVGVFPGFSKIYGVHHLVWYERHETMESAIVREKELKKWPHQRKIYTIELTNSDWLDLSQTLH